MRYLLLIPVLFFSIPSFSKGSCLNIFSKKTSEEPFTVDSIRDLRFKEKMDPVFMTTMIGGVAVWGVGAIEMNVPLMLIGGVTGVLGYKISSSNFKAQWLKATFKTFREGLISKYVEERVDTFAKKDKNFIYEVVPFIGRGISKAKAKKIIQFLIDKGEDINEGIVSVDVKVERDTPMHRAVRLNNPLAIEILYELGADIHKDNSDGVSPLTVGIDGANSHKKTQKTLANILVQEASRKTIEGLKAKKAEGV